MGHGNLSDYPEWFAFADSVLKEGKPWIQEKSSKLESGKAQATFESSKLLESVVLVSTTGIGLAARSGWLEVDLGEEKEINRVRLSEVEWHETREFAIEFKQGDVWKEVARGTTIGKEEELSFPPVKAQVVRLNVLKAEHAINLNEFQVFEK